MSADFGLASYAEDDRTFLVLSGDLDMSTAPQVRAAVDEIATVNLTIDMSGVPFMDSSGVNVIATTIHRRRTTGGGVTLRNVQPEPMRVFQITGVVDMCPFESAPGGEP